jgi:hypothetical protein
MQAILVLFGVFTFLFLLLTGWCFVTLIIARGHRAPCAFLLPALILYTLANANNAGLEVLSNMPYSVYNLSPQLRLGLESIGTFFRNWAIFLLFLSIIAVLWNRETVLHTATEGKAGGHNPIFAVIYAILALTLLVLGTAGRSIVHP